MGDNSQNNVDSDPRSRYNLRERKQITSTVTSQDQQLAQLSDVETSRKRKRIENSTRIKNKPARKLTFLDLPPEVRNEIYTLVLYARPKKRLSRPKLPLPKLDTKWKGLQMTKSREKDLRNFQRWQMEVAAIVDPIDGRPHYTSQFSPGLYSPCGVFAHNYRGDRFKIDTLWHKDPALWQVSRQIRQEARSLHVAKSVSFDVRGTDRMLSWSQDPIINSGLSRFEHWFTKMLDDDLQRGIMRLELCDYVQAIASPVRMVADQLADDKFYRLNGGFLYDFIPAFQLEICEDSQVFRVRTPLKLMPTQAAKLQTKLDHMVDRKTQQNQQDQHAVDISFDGRDIAECVRFLRGSASWPEIVSDRVNTIIIRDDDEKHHIVNSWSTVRFSMIIDKEGEREMFLGLGSRKTAYNCTFEYIAATARMPTSTQK